MANDFELTWDELRLVTGFVAGSAQPLLVVFESAHPGDARPRAALAAAWQFVDGAPRAKVHRTASMDAHRAAASAGGEPARLAAQAAGDAASAAYLHPIARSHQVGHILRAAANAALVAELRDDTDPDAAERSLVQARARATPALVDVLCRYPRASAGRGRASRLMSQLDAMLRE